MSKFYFVIAVLLISLNSWAKQGPPSQQCWEWWGNTGIAPEPTFACRGRCVTASTSLATYGCDDNAWCADYFCQSKKYCPSNMVYNGATELCESRCPEGATGQFCDMPEQQKSCESQGANPIDFMDGQKYRNEHVITAGFNQPFDMRFFYSSKNGFEKTFGGLFANSGGGGDVTATAAPMDEPSYASGYAPTGLLLGALNPDQHFGNMTQYWRHNFDDVLLIGLNEFKLHMAQGQTLTFSSLGHSQTYPQHALLALQAGEADYTGYKWINYNTGQQKYFDSTGKLRQVYNNALDVLTLTYDAENQLQSIANLEGARLIMEHISKETNSIYAIDKSPLTFLSKVTYGNTAVEIKWEHSHGGATANFYLITQITQASRLPAKIAREFAYNNENSSALLTDIYTVSNIDANAKVVFAHFKYDDKNKAIYSGLADGVNAVTVDYTDNSITTVTNSLGKPTTFTFATTGNVKRLKKITGEPINSCLQSDLEYFYNTNGTVAKKVQNGKTTLYSQYDERLRQTQRTEAAATADARTITTEWHPKHHVMSKIITPKTTKTWHYREDGRLQSIDMTTNDASAP